MTVAQALNTIISNFGIEILNAPDRVQSMVMDYAGSTERNAHLFCLVCRNKILNIAQEMYVTSDYNKSMILAKKAKAILRKDFFMDEENSILCVNMILEGVSNEARLYFDKSKGTDIVKGPKSGDELKAASLYAHNSSLSPKCSRIIDEELLLQLQQSAQNGNLYAIIQLGEYYQYGNNIKLNRRMAEFYYRKAIELGNQGTDFETELLVKEAKLKLNKLYNLHQVDHNK